MMGSNLNLSENWQNYKFISQVHCLVKQTEYANILYASEEQTYFHNFPHFPTAGATPNF